MSPLGNRSKPEYRRREAAQTPTARWACHQYYQGDTAGASGGTTTRMRSRSGHQATSGARQDQDQYSASPLSIYGHPPTCCSAPLHGGLSSLTNAKARTSKIHSGCGCTLISRLTNCSLNLLSLSRSRFSEHVHGPAKVHGPAHGVATESPTPRIARSSSCRPPEASRTSPRSRGSPVPLVSLVRSERSYPPDSMLKVLRISSLRGRRGN